MEIPKLVKAIIPDITAGDHGAVLDRLTALVLPGLEGPEGEKVLCDLKDHESAGGVLTGTGSAIFHCLCDRVEEPVIGLAISKKGVRGRGIRGRFRIFFLVASPTRESGTHLQILSNLERMLLDPTFRNALLRAKSEEEAKKALEAAAGAARGAFVPLGKSEVLAELGTSDSGLTEEEALKRLKLVGQNTIKKIRKSTLLKDFFYNFVNLFAILLWAGGILALVSGMPELGVAISLVIIINALFSFWQEYKAERAIEALGRLLPKKVRVVRGGAESEVEAARLVPGDLVRLSEGDTVPADGRLIVAEEMRIDNSSLTGESKPIYKISEPLLDGTPFLWTEVPNLVFAGTTVLSGRGSMVVTATGMKTEIGKVAFLTQTIKTERSPLQIEIANLTRTITLLAVTLGAFFFLLGYGIAGLTFTDSYLFAIGVIVANVPEGLLPTVSLSLAMSVQRMAKKNAIVKKLSAVESLGSATVICTDKTGTLTANQMSVREVYVNGRTIEATGAGYEPVGDFILAGKSLSKEELEAAGVSRLLGAAALCNNASLHPPAGKEGWRISGDPTEGALLTAAAKAGLDVAGLMNDYQRTFHIPFERVRKRMSTIHEAKGAPPGTGAVFVKGAPGEVLDLCETAYLEGNAVPIGPVKENIRAEIDRMASRGLRVLAIATRDIGLKRTYLADEVERGLTFIGLVAMFDPPRPGVKTAIRECKTAGIKVVMITGDYGLTAKAIAVQIGLNRAKVYTGAELNKMTGHELEGALKEEEAIFARVVPEDKLRVVEALQRNGEVVAVTGDGVNDAPALKKADIGIAMGLRGSDAAKESAEIVLADDNFSSIVDAVKEGRAAYRNIKKFVTYILTHNVAELIPVIAFVVFKIPLPLTVMQMLAIDLGSDIFPSLGLGVEPPEKWIMEERPRQKTERLLDRNTLSRVYLFLGPVEAILALSAFFFAYWLRGVPPTETLPASGAVYAAATTMTFAGIVASQAGNVFACRTERESVFSKGAFLKNRFVLWSLFVEAALISALIYVPFLSPVFGFYPLTLSDWAFVIAFPAIMLGSSELRKAILRKKHVYSA